ncbi:type I glyceraldehyde-3-phosphate dehydrogenase [Patescibacteria group bacterium]|nr:type I glyceraldehyde-3-phosphate dehydrogenase [Patescibacteria group bacterium]
MMTKIAINGFGRIGRPSFKVALDSHELEVVAINDLTETKSLAHLLQYDSVYGKFDRVVSYDQKNIIVDDKKFPVFAEKDPANLPWGKLNVDIVLECTGHFTSRQGAEKHLKAGAKRVIISANPKDSDIPTFINGVNQEKFDPKKDLVISNGSCTTNCLLPLIKVLNDTFGINQGFMTTVHAYTGDQKLLDLLHQDLRRARGAAQNLIPTTTGAIKSVMTIIPELKGKFDGLAVRVPVPVGSLIDLVCLVNKSTTVEEVNNKFKELAKGELKEVLGITEEPLVSSDFIGDPHSAIVDLTLTKVKGNLIKMFAWYDNEYGYACRYMAMTEYIGGKI